jgi:hypothetical protein
MNLSPEGLERLLTELADRADSDQVGDRVPAIRGRVRRAARRRAAALAAAATVIIVLLAPDEKVAALLKPQRGGRIVVISVTIRGRVPQASTFDARDGKPTDNLRELLMDWGNEGWEGTQGVLPVEGFGCDAGAPFIDISTSFVVTHEYLQPGPETATFLTGACAPVGPVEQKLSFMVK